MEPSAARFAALAIMLVQVNLGPALAAQRRVESERRLLWPLQIPGVLLSSFGEYRYDHLHAGIDISTQGATGYKVIAAEAGEIYRLKVEWRGYGRAIYLRHPGGRISVYGHLERYEDQALGLERRVARRQADAGTRYPGDIYLDPPLPVRRGQVIAYSGESGVGLPHLHFEVRERDDEPIDPFAAGLAPPEDRRPPILESLDVTAGGRETFVDGVQREKVYPLSRHEGIYVAAGPIRVNGPFLIAVQGYDPAGAGGRAGIHSIEVRIDGRPAYRLMLHSFRFDQYPLSGLIYDHRRSHLGPATFTYRLYRLPGNDLADGTAEPLQGSRQIHPGSLDLDPGIHRIEITASDEAGNLSRARACVLVARPEAPSILPTEPGRSAALVRFALDGGRAAQDTDDGAAAASDRGAAEGDPSCPVPPRAVESEVWSGGRFSPAACRIDQGICDLSEASGRAGPVGLRIREIRGGVPGPWSIALFERSGEAFALRDAPRVEAWPGSLDVVLTLPPAPAPTLMLASPHGGVAERFVYRDDLRWVAALDYQRAESPDLWIVSSEAPGKPLSRLDLNVRYAVPGGTTAVRGPGYSVDVPEGGRFYPGPLLARSGEIHEVPGLKAMEKAIELLPEGEALNAPATLKFDTGAAAGQSRALGIYRWDGVSESWIYEGGDPDPARGSISLKFRRYGRFALLLDESPPVITEVIPANGSRGLPQRPAIEARVQEIGMGLNYDGVAFVLDGSPLESEFDPDRGLSKVLDPPVLSPGRHVLVVLATDRAGNSSAPHTVAFDVR